MRAITKPVVVAVLAALVGAPAAPAVPVTDLGAWDGVGGFRPVAVSGGGYVAGTTVVAVSPDEYGHAAVWKAGVLTDLGTLLPSPGTNKSSGAYDVNDAGRVTGLSNTANDFSGEHAFVRTAPAAIVDLGVVDDTVFSPGSTGRGVNAQGVVVGNSMRAVGATERDQGFRWSSGSLAAGNAVPGGAGDAANDVHLFAVADGASSRAVGARNWSELSGGGSGIVVEANGSVAALPFVPGRHGISPDGHWAAGATGAGVAQRYDLALHAGQALGPLAPAATSVANAVSTGGLVVGASGGKAVIWRDAVAIDLNSLLDDGSGWVLQNALDVTDANLVVGYGTKDGVRHGFLIDATGDSTITVNLKTDQEDGNQTPPASRDGVCDADRTKAGLQCTLRAAIQTANENADKNRIVFDIPGGALPTITPASVLPAFTAPVALDGRTQPGTPAGKPGVELDGRNAGGRSNGLRVQGGNSEIRGLIINRFTFPGISVKANGGVKIQGNWIGLDRAGTGSTFVDAGNSSGIDIGTTDVLIGGPTPADRNVISGNGNETSARKFFEYQAIRNSTFDDLIAQPSTLQDVERQIGAGIVIHRASAGNVRIEGNWIGVNPDGTRPAALTLDQTTPPAFGNVFGILVGPAREGGPATGQITIGGVTGTPGTGAGNVISGNVVGVFAAPFVRGFSISSLRILGNRIGPDANDRPLKDLSSLAGVMAMGDIGALEIADNQVQNVGIGLFLAPKHGASVRGNLIGVDQPLTDLFDQVKANDGSPTLGRRNLLGVVAASTGALQFGGPGAAGNRVVGNLFQQAVVMLGPGGRIEGNTFGTARSSSGDVLKAVRDYSGLGGVMVFGKGGEVVRNRVSGTITGLQAVFTPDFRVEQNTVDGNLIGLHTMFAPRSEFLRNTFTRNVMGTFLFGFWPTDAELRQAGLDPAEFGEAAQKKLFTGLAADKVGQLGRIDSADVQTSSDGKTFRAPLAPLTLEELLTSARTTWYGNTWGSTTDPTRGNFFGFWALGDVRQLRLGGTAANQGNTFGHNLTAIWLGPAFAGHQPESVEIRGNTITRTGHFPGRAEPVEPLQTGIDLLPQVSEGVSDPAQYFGRDPNDIGDGDTGPNGMQNSPLLLGVESLSGTQYRVRGVLPSKPGTRYTVDLYLSAACPGSGRTGGARAERWLGEVAVTTDGFGNGTFDATLPRPSGWATLSDHVTATATAPADADGFGATSEISDCVRVGAPVGNVIVNGVGEPTAGPDIFIVNAGGSTVTPGPGDSVIGSGDGTVVTAPPAGQAPLGRGGAVTPDGVEVSLTGANVRVTLGGGDDAVSVQGAGARIVTGEGSDAVRVVGARATVDGGGGGDTLVVAGAGAVARGGAGNDLVRITGATALGVGAGGRDVIAIVGPRGRADGGAGADDLSVRGARGAVIAGAGNDRILVAGGAATVDAGGGNDTIRAKNRKRDRLDGGAGRDVATVDRSDVLRRIERKLR